MDIYVPERQRTHVDFEAGSQKPCVDLLDLQNIFGILKKRLRELDSCLVQASPSKINKAEI